MDWNTIWHQVAQWGIEQVAGYIIAAIFAILWVRGRKAEGALVAGVRAYADKLPKWQHDAIESFIVRAQKEFADWSGPERMNLVLQWMEDRGIPINRAYVQVTYNALVREDKLDKPKEAKNA